jgi:beta-glucosidase
MRSLVGDRLPNFTAQETSDLRGSYDILGLNYYGAYYAKNLTRVDPDPTHLRYAIDSHANVTGKLTIKTIQIFSHLAILSLKLFYLLIISFLHNFLSRH